MDDADPVENREQGVHRDRFREEREYSGAVVEGNSGRKDNGLERRRGSARTEEEIERKREEEGRFER